MKPLGTPPSSLQAVWKLGLVVVYSVHTENQLMPKWGSWKDANLSNSQNIECAMPEKALIAKDQKSYPITCRHSPAEFKPQMKDGTYSEPHILSTCLLLSVQLISGALQLKWSCRFGCQSKSELGETWI